MYKLYDKADIPTHIVIGSLTLADKISAETLINALPTGSDKTDLIERLTGLKQILNLNSATTAVTLA